MSDVLNSDFLAHHPPPIRVGGRRHSISTKHRPHPPASDAEPVRRSGSTPPTEVEQPLDYPRPAAPAAGDEAPHVPPHHNEDEHQRKDKKHDSERKVLELAQRKADMTLPTRIPKNTGKGFGAAGRIAQPMKDVRV
ncbi:hypothetical protein DFH06DRAFT_331428 [Mycena polygramma]|nr:hypothetical protein DFH06DRAFT_331428 [Mycena polygramma]